MLRVLVFSGLLTLAGCGTTPPSPELVPSRLACAQAALEYMNTAEAVKICTGGKQSGSDCALDLNDLKKLHLLQARAEVLCAD